ncbi:MAG TPA: Crp/Fnr family transcriptional regulator [Chitinophagaceae bacterium]|jgi:CRP-like cAMP-binding protein|nr:Crp/Fnr family transcriptional regulator [Chitinophagaceae bacterium]
MKEDAAQTPWNKYIHLSERLEIPAKTVLLREGHVATHTYYLERGCVRIWFNHAGKDITLDFFLEGEGVSSIESFRTGRPSDFYLESLEPCILYRIAKKDFEFMLGDAPAFRKRIEDLTFQTLFRYQQLFLSRIKNSPEERYRELLHTRPELLQRIPQHYIASYLGMTPVSLSRIRNKR